MISTWISLSAVVALGLASAVTSGLETALFSLTPAERRRAGSNTLALLARPGRLLVAILLLNLGFNFLLFSLAARLGRSLFPDREFLLAGFTLGAVVCLCEVLPKTLALRARMPIARLLSYPFALLLGALGPLIAVIERALALFFRALGPAADNEGGVTSEDLARALTKHASHGLLLDTEAEIVAGIAELDSVRVRELMTPRVDLILFDLDKADNQAALAAAIAMKEPWVVAVRGGADHVVGRLRVADLLVHPKRPPSEFLQPVLFVPEVASALHLLEFLRAKRASLAVVVDEWGGTAGSVAIEDVFEHIVGDLRVEGEARQENARSLGHGHWLVPGSLSIRDWNETFRTRMVPREYETVGGFVTGLLGRFPKSGDQVHAGGLSFCVREVRGRRIQSLELFADSEEQT